MGRRRAVAGLVVGVTAGHLVLLSMWGAPVGVARSAPVAARVVEVVAVGGKAHATGAAVADRTAHVPAPAPARRPATEPAPAPGPAPAPTQARANEPARAREPSPPADPVLVARGAATDADLPSPLPPQAFPTRAPPAARLRFEAIESGRPGTATLDWQPGDAGWTLQIDLAIDGRPVRRWRGSGGLDARGLAPERLEQWDRGRPRHALTMQRDRGVVGFSAREAERPLVPGLQDRWSWLLQLVAAAGGADARWPPGTALALDVADLRGDLARWVFVVPDDDPGGHDTPAPLHLRRAPSRPWDLQVDVWLDGAPPHLPTALRLAVPPGRWTLELHRTDPPQVGCDDKC